MEGETSSKKKESGERSPDPPPESREQRDDSDRQQTQQADSKQGMSDADREAAYSRLDQDKTEVKEQSPDRPGESPQQREESNEEVRQNSHGDAGRSMSDADREAAYGNLSEEKTEAKEQSPDRPGEPPQQREESNGEVRQNSQGDAGRSMSDADREAAYGGLDQKKAEARGQSPDRAGESPQQREESNGEVRQDSQGDAGRSMSDADREAAYGGLDQKKAEARGQSPDRAGESPQQREGSEVTQTRQADASQPPSDPERQAKGDSSNRENPETGNQAQDQPEKPKMVLKGGLEYWEGRPPDEPQAASEKERQDEGDGSDRGNAGGGNQSQDHQRETSLRREDLDNEHAQARQADERQAKSERERQPAEESVDQERTKEQAQDRQRETSLRREDLDREVTQVRQDDAQAWSQQERQTAENTPDRESTQTVERSQDQQRESPRQSENVNNDVAQARQDDTTQQREYSNDIAQSRQADVPQQPENLDKDVTQPWPPEALQPNFEQERQPVEASADREKADETLPERPGESPQQQEKEAPKPETPGNERATPPPANPDPGAGSPAGQGNEPGEPGGIAGAVRGGLQQFDQALGNLPGGPEGLQNLSRWTKEQADELKKEFDMTKPHTGLKYVAAAIENEPEAILGFAKKGLEGAKILTSEPAKEAMKQVEKNVAKNLEKGVEDVVETPKIAPPHEAPVTMSQPEIPRPRGEMDERLAKLTEQVEKDPTTLRLRQELEEAKKEHMDALLAPVQPKPTVEQQLAATRRPIPGEPLEQQLAATQVPISTVEQYVAATREATPEIKEAAARIEAARTALESHLKPFEERAKRMMETSSEAPNPLHPGGHLEVQPHPELPEVPRHEQTREKLMKLQEEMQDRFHALANQHSEAVEKQGELMNALKTETDWRKRDVLEKELEFEQLKHAMALDGHKAWEKERLAKARAIVELPENMRSEIEIVDHAGLQNHKEFQEGMDIYKRYTSKKMDLGRKVDVYEAPLNQRSSSNGKSIWIERADKRVTTTPHELAHIHEAEHPEVLQASKEFLERKTAGETPVKLQDLDPRANYGADEMCRPDKFPHPYVGKEYRDATGNIVATEVLSKGIEYLHDDPVKFAKHHPEYFDHVIKCLQGFYKKK